MDLPSLVCGKITIGIITIAFITFRLDNKKKKQKVNVMDNVGNRQNRVLGLLR